MSAASLLGAVGSNGHDSEDDFDDDQGGIDDTDEDSDIENEPDARWRSRLLSIKSGWEWSVITRQAPDGYAVGLGKALTNNTSVSDLSLDLRRNRMLLQDEADISYSDGIVQLSPLLLCLRDGRSATTVYMSSCQSKFSGACLEAIGTNPNLVDLTIAHDTLSNEIPQLDLATLISSTSSLRTLTMSSCFDHTRSEMVANALGGNRTLQTLCLKEINPAEMRDILHGLQSNTYLTCLHLWPTDYGSMDTVHSALEAYLLHTPSLRKLAFRCFVFDTQWLQALFRSLSANPTVTELDFYLCTIMRDALLAKNMVPLQGIRSLRLSGLDDEMEFGRGSLNVIKAMVGNFPSLEELSWENYREDGVDGEHNMTPFWNDLRASASSRSLKTLKLFSLTSNGHAAMNSCLPELTSLRTLEVDIDDLQQRQVVPFLRAVRKNGSLHQVSIGEEDPRVWKRKEGRILRAALQRNVQLPRVLAAEAAPSRSTRLTRANSSVSTRHSQRFPTLFLSAMQTPRMSPNHVLAGLRTLNEQIAPRGGSGAKRSLGVK